MKKRLLMAGVLVLAVAVWGCSSSSSNPGGGGEDAVETTGDNGGGETTGGGDVTETKDTTGKDTTGTDKGGDTGKETTGGDTTTDTGGSETASDIPSDVPKLKECKEDQLPTEWDPATVLYAIQIVDSQDSQAMGQCADFDGDDNPDNGLGSLAGMANGQIPQDGSMAKDAGIMLEFVDVDDYTNADGFQLNGLVGKLKDGDKAEKDKSNEMYVEPRSYADINGECGPIITFKDASIKDGKLDSGEGNFDFVMDLQGIPLRLRVSKARIRGDVTEGGQDGVVIDNGVLTGYVMKEDLDNALNEAQKYCDSFDENDPDRPSFCDYLGMAGGMLENLYDLDLDNNGEMDAVSLCVTFNSVKAKIVGLVPSNQ